MKILVSGGAGFIGSNLCAKLKEKDLEVIIVDDLSTGSEGNLIEGCDFYNLDLSKEDSYKKLPKNIDIVFHLASQVSSEMSFINPINDMKRNSLATLLMLDWSLRSSVKRFLYTSSMGVYGSNPKGPSKETSHLSPTSFYGINKRASEEFIKIYSNKGLEYTIFRLFNVYGPGQDMSNLNQGMVSIYLEYILRNKPILVKGSLDRIRDYVFIEDVTHALMLGLHEKAKNKIYNVCSGQKTSVKELIDSILLAVDKSLDYPINILPATPNDIYQIWGNCDKLINEFDWSPRFKLDKGLSKFIEALKI